MAKSHPFATFLIIGPVCFFLGMLFSLFPYDYYVLWAAPPLNHPTIPSLDAPAQTLSTNVSARREPYLLLLESHLRFLHAAPPLIARILHIAMGTGLGGILLKLWKPTEANMLFDGASLVLYVCGVAIYVSNIVSGLRIVTAGVYGDASKLSAEEVALQEASGGVVVGREDSLKVLAASNTILALVLVGVLVLQAGQWYAAKREEAEVAEMEANDAKRRARSEGRSGSVAEGSRTVSGGSVSGEEKTYGKKKQ